MKMKFQFINGLWIMLAGLALILVTTVPVKAVPPGPIDDDPIGEIPFVPPDNGFDWSVPNRFGGDENGDGLVDFHWMHDGDYDPNGFYDPTYVHPNEYPVNIEGCRTEDEYWTGMSANTYHWRFLNPGDAEDAPGEVIQGNECRITKVFPAQATYRVRLTIRRPDNSVVLDEQGRGDPFRQDVVVKDYLIVSIGDSFASGEGNPDIRGYLSYFPYPIPGQWWVDSRPRWQDARCGRSVWGGPAQAAIAIESSDRHTSVTFLSFACSGSTIDTPFWKGNEIDKYLGVGILRPYRGSEAPDDYSYEESTFVPSQIDQLRAAVGERPIDALIISGGGNDIRFGTVAEKCVTTANCWINATGAEIPNGNTYVLHELVRRAVSALPGKFALLADEVETFNVANVFITEYPDLTPSDTPNAPNELDRYCALVYDILPGFQISPAESKSAVDLALDPLNEEVANAAAAHGWVLVDGIAEQFRVGPDGKGHGYCASEAWIRSASDGFFMQGPFWGDVYPVPMDLFKQTTKGTLHPTARGHQVIAQRLREEILPRLNPNQPTTPPPAFSSSLTSGSSTSRQGENGWLTGRCDGSTCTSDQAVLRIDAAAQGIGTVLRGTKVTINGVEGCSGVPGISCSSTTGAGQVSQTWTFDITQTGVYRLQFLAKDSNLQVSTFAYEVKVDLNDPEASAQIIPESPNSAGWYAAPVSVTFSGSDQGGISGVAVVEYILDGVPGQSEPGSPLPVAENGPHTLTYQTVDQAGRRSQQQALSFQIDQAAPTTTPTLSAGGSAYVPGSWTRLDILVALDAADNAGGSGVALLAYSTAGAQTIQETIVESWPAQFSVTEEGETTLDFLAEDAAGNIETTQTLVLRIDRTAPTFTCGAEDGAWHNSDVSISCSASDNGAGFAGGSSTSFTLTTSVPDGTETANAPTNSHRVCDLAENCASVPAVSGIKVDKKAPEITITAPANTAYTLNQTVLSSYTCADGGSGLATCGGTAASGSPINTSTVGDKTFQVNAADLAGNSSSLTVGYQVSYKVCLLYDPAKSHKVGSTMPLRIQLCDAGDADRSAPEIVVTAQGLTKVDNTASSSIEDSGNSNPDSNFRFDASLPGYAYNLSTKSLTRGTWALRLAVTGDPLVHTIYFDLR
jgi:hypothetical protein